MFALTHGRKFIVLTDKYRMNQGHIYLLLQANVQKGLHIELNIVDLVTLGIIDQHVTLLRFFLDTDHLLTQGAQFGGVMPDAAKRIDSCLAVVALTGNIIRNRFRGQCANRLFIDLNQFIEFLKIVVATVPKVLELFLHLHLLWAHFKGQLFLYSCGGGLEFYSGDLC